MKRISYFVVLFVVLGAAACNKPSTDDCRKAIANMRSIHGTDSPTTNRNIESDVRSCKGGSSKEAVSCAIKATTLEELNACGFMKHKGAGSAAAGSDVTGSGSSGATDPGAGSAAPGSGADPAAGSAGSGADTAAGSAAADGSGAMGSDSAGSAAPGSAAGGN